MKARVLEHVHRTPPPADWLTNAMNVRFALILAIVCTHGYRYTFHFTSRYCDCGEMAEHG